MSLDPQIEILLGLAKQANLPEIWQLTPDQGREQYLTRVNKLKFSEPIFRTEDRRIAGPGSDIALRIYTPREIKTTERKAKGTQAACAAVPACAPWPLPRIGPAPEKRVRR